MQTLTPFSGPFSAVTPASGGTKGSRTLSCASFFPFRVLTDTVTLSLAFAQGRETVSLNTPFSVSFSIYLILCVTDVTDIIT